MKKVFVSLGMMVAVLCGAVAPMVGVTEVYAEEKTTEKEAATDICSDALVKEELKQAAGCADFKAGDEKTAVPIFLNIINVVLSFVGIIAVLVIVYGGILYATSTGDASKVHKAKNCILYGVVGLVVAIMAFAIVGFVNASVLQK